MINTKYELRNTKQKSNKQKIKGERYHPEYDLEERTFRFAKRVREFIKQLPKSISNNEDSVQLNNASGSQGANYIEANEAISKKDFIFRIKICRKETKESRYWLRMVDLGKDKALDKERKILIQEATELMMIFGSIYRKSQNFK